MAFIYNVNQRQITNGTMIYQIILTLVNAGWTVLGSGDGTGGNYSAGGNTFTSGGRVAHGTYNVGSWFRIQAPANPVTGQKREFCLQQGSSTTQASYRIKYSANVTGSGGFTGGSPSATRVPSATDEQVLVGGGSDASPTYVVGTAVDYLFASHMVADAGAIDHAFYILTTQETSTGATGFQLALDTMLPGTYAPQDPDPAVVYLNVSSSGTGYGGDLRSTAIHGYVGTTITSANFVTNFYLSNTGGYPGGLATESTSGYDPVVIPIWNAGNSFPTATKGTSQLFMYIGPVRGNGYVLQINPTTGGDHIMMNGTLLPWPPNTNLFVP